MALSLIKNAQEATDDNWVVQYITTENVDGFEMGHKLWYGWIF
jgi:hypothetical protein